MIPISFPPHVHVLTTLLLNQPYATSKAAQIHLVKCLASICAPSIRVNCVSPALLLTVRYERPYRSGSHTLTQSLGLGALFPRGEDCGCKGEQQAEEACYGGGYGRASTGFYRL